MNIISLYIKELMTSDYVFISMANTFRKLEADTKNQKLIVGSLSLLKFRSEILPRCTSKYNLNLYQIEIIFRLFLFYQY